MRSFVASCLLLFAALPAAADVVYRYVGMPFTQFIGADYTSADFLSGTIQLSSPLPPDTSLLVTTSSAISLKAWSFSDGLKSFTDSNSALAVPAFVMTDHAGGIAQSDFNFTRGPTIGEMNISNNGPLDQTDGATNVSGASFSQGSNQNAPGTWTLVPEPDSDGDGVADAVDDCPHLANADQTDTGGIGAGSPPDGIGDACQCGDVNGDGRVTLADAVVIARSLLQPPAATLTKPELCDVGGTAGCTLADAVVVRRAQLQPPAATVVQACAPANP